MTEETWVQGTRHPTGGYDRRTKLFRATHYYLSDRSRAFVEPDVGGDPARIIPSVLHRLDGPAIEAVRMGTTDEYYLLGTPVSREMHAEAVRLHSEGAPLEWAIAYAVGETAE